MPKFTLNKPARKTPPHAYYGLDEFAQGYVEAMFFTNGGTDMRNYKVKGDWLVNGYIDNLNRPRTLEIVVVEGRAYDAGLYGGPDDDGRLALTAAGELKAWGSAVAFLPDGGEIERLGGASIFKAA